ncbi:MAG TPA: DUF4878 domain-containing protein [Ferruginibacter sp.]|nr:DUF4878 domain-containing protein [Ferruginibacter sp.]
MKKMIWALFLAAGLFACNSKDAAGPSSTSPTASVEGLFNAMKNGQIDDFKKFITKKDAETFASIEKLANNLDSGFVKEVKERMVKELKERSKNITYKLKGEKIDGDNASVDAEVTDSSKTETHTFQLVKEDGEWKLSLSKPGNEMFNSMKGNRGHEQPDMEEAFDKFKKMSPDSQRMLLEKAKQVFDTLKARKGDL